MNIIDKFHNWRRKLRWNRQYKKGRWESLKKDIETKRYFQIGEYLKAFGSKNPRILDIGCGDGVLNLRMKDYEYAYFLGIDFSKVSIEKALSINFKNSDFKVADVVNFKPQQNFDAIIFNEAFYYIHDTERHNVLNRMLDSLNDNGIIITSIYREGIGCWEYFKENPKLKELAFTTVATHEEKTYWKIGVYTKNNA